MNTEIENAIKFLAEKVKGDIKAGEALQFTQAALNLAHTAATLANTKTAFNRHGDARTHDPAKLASLRQTVRISQPQPMARRLLLCWLRSSA